MPVGLRIADLVVFGGIGTLLLIHGLSGRVALRVDASGVTLGGTALRYRSTTRLVPWADIDAIVVWQRRQLRGGPLTYIGLAPRPDTPQAGSAATRVAARANAWAASAIPGGAYLGIRAVTGWHLDLTDLAAATARFAPDVPVVSLDRL